MTDSKKYLKVNENIDPLLKTTREMVTGVQTEQIEVGKSIERYIKQVSQTRGEKYAEMLMNLPFQIGAALGSKKARNILQERTSPLNYTDGLLQSSVKVLEDRIIGSAKEYEIITEKIKSFTETKEKYQKKEMNLKELQEFLIGHAEYKSQQGFDAAMETLGGIEDTEINRKNLEMALGNSLKVLEMEKKVIDDGGRLLKHQFGRNILGLSMYRTLKTGIESLVKTTGALGDGVKDTLFAAEFIQQHVTGTSQAFLLISDGIKIANERPIYSDKTVEIFKQYSEKIKTKVDETINIGIKEQAKAKEINKTIDNLGVNVDDKIKTAGKGKIPGGRKKVKI